MFLDEVVGHGSSGSWLIVLTVFFFLRRYNATNQHFVEVADGFSLLAHLLERVSPTYMTSDTVTAVVNLCARVRFSEYYVNKAMKHLLTNLRLWLFTPLQASER